MRNVMRVVSVHCYPVKGCRELEGVQELELGPHGLARDRVWMVVEADDPTKFVTQRGDPSLTQVKPSFIPFGGSEVLRLEARRIGETTITDRGYDASRRVDTLVHGEPCVGYDVGDEPADFFSTLLGRRVRLLRKSRNDPRVSSRVPDGGEGQLGFADSYPMLFTSLGSLAALNKARPDGMQPIIMDHFRPNVVLDAREPWIEELMLQMRINGIPLHGVKPSRRCVVITTDQRTGARDPRVLTLLTAVHTAPRKGKEAPIFGMNVIPGSLPRGEALLRVGALVEDIVIGPRPSL